MSANNVLLKLSTEQVELLDSVFNCIHNEYYFTHIIFKKISEGVYQPISKEELPKEFKQYIESLK